MISRLEIRITHSKESPFQNYYAAYLSLKIVFILVNSAVPDGQMRCPNMHCLPLYRLTCFVYCVHVG